MRGLLSNTDFFFIAFREGMCYCYGVFAGVIQWQNRSFPCFLRGFDSLRPLHFGLLAQLVRALPSHGRGRWFESSTAHHFGGFLSETAFLF